MRNLNQVPNIGGSTSDYPDGVIVDENLGTIGTAVSELLYGDIIQAMHKLKRLMGITPNSQPDNESNGYQALTGLLANMLPHWQPPTSGLDLSQTKFVYYNNALYYHKTLVNTNNNPSSDSTNWQLVLNWNGSYIALPNDADIAELDNRVTGNESNITINDNRLDDLEVYYTAPILRNGSYFPTTNYDINLTRKGYMVCISGKFQTYGNFGATEVNALYMTGTFPVPYPTKDEYTIACSANDNNNTLLIRIDIFGNIWFKGNDLTGTPYQFSITYYSSI